MTAIRNLSFACVMLSIVAACANPVVAPRMAAMDYEKDCAAIEDDIAETSALKRDARAEDKFQWKYIFIINGFVSAWRINKAEQAAQERLDALREAGQRKGCFGGQDKVLDPVAEPEF